jgi:SAM-dependent methyltransferase
MACSSVAEAARCTLCQGREHRPLFTKRGWTFIRCTSCGLVSVAPLPTPEALREHHELSYARGPYAVYAAAADVREAIARHRLHLLRPLAPPGAWLEVGCGTGSFLREATAAGVEIEGVELVAGAVARARATGLVVHHAAIEDFEPPRSYSTVIAFDVMEHLLDPTAFARRARTWMHAGGLLAVTVPDCRSMPARVLGRRWFQYWPPDHLYYFTASTIRRLLEAAHFSVVRTRALPKPLRLDYAAQRLARTNPRQGGLVAALIVLLPRALRTRSWHVPVGEMLVLATAT